MIHVTQLPTQKEVETKITDGIERFYEELFSVRPRHIQVNVLPHAVAIVTQNNLTVAEQQVMRQGDGHHDAARQMFKNMRALIIFANRTLLVDIIEKATHVSVTCCHHDISAVTGEEVFLFSLHAQPTYRRLGYVGFVERRMSTHNVVLN